MDKLSEQEIDKELMDRDDRKPLRKLVDDKIVPAGSLLVGGAMAGAGALGNIKQKARLYTVA